jgi:hypothetical protein
VDRRPFTPPRPEYRGRNTADAKDPRAAEEPDTEAPSTPAVRASATNTSVVVSWDAATDDTGVTKYQLTRTGGTKGTTVIDVASNAFLSGNTYHAPDHSRFSGMNIIDMRMHMNFSDAQNAYNNGKDSDDSVNDATYNVVYVDSHDYGPNKSSTRYSGGTAAWAENMSLMWTFRGIPTLYYGSEIEFQQGQRIDCGPTCPLATTGRAYYGDHLAGSVTASDFGTVASAPTARSRPRSPIPW